MTVLCIDDDPEDMEFFCEAINVVDPSYICLSAVNGEMGIEILRTIHVDVIFLDINMPVLNGNETLARILGDSKTRIIPVFMLSTTVNVEELAVYEKMGARACLIKPNSFFELCRILRTILQSPNMPS